MVLERYAVDRAKVWILGVAFPLTLVCHVGLFLVVQWNVELRATVGYTHAAVDEIEDEGEAWSHVYVLPPENCGNDSIVPIASRTTYSDGETTALVYTVRFQEITFRCHTMPEHMMDTTYSDLFGDNHVALEEESSVPPLEWARLHFPIDLGLKFYKTWMGHSTKAQLKAGKILYGANDQSIPTPTLLECLLPQLIAPFFLFQTFCVALWSLDEYWYYAIFTLLTLLMFEGTVAINRRRNMMRLREAMRAPRPIYAYRLGNWAPILSSQLLAGDLVSLKSTPRAKDENLVVPADLLLLRGCAVIDEAMLTGESVPQLKEAIDASDASTQLDIEDGLYKKSIVFGGTIPVDHNPKGCDGSSDVKNVPDPPDGGCLGFVLRTGFETQQGSLLRIMMFLRNDTANDGVNSNDTFKFILLLLLCAVFSALLVLSHSWYDPTRNQFKLLLHVVIILTSVVPPELPMELSLAVTSSLSDLMKLNVFCTEPFRIPMAGMIDTCCFDKTGTLTSDEMRLRGVRLSAGGVKGFHELPCQDGTKHGR